MQFNLKVQLSAQRHRIVAKAAFGQLAKQQAEAAEKAQMVSHPHVDSIDVAIGNALDEVFGAEPANETIRQSMVVGAGRTAKENLGRRYRLLAPTSKESPVAIPVKTTLESRFWAQVEAKFRELLIEAGRSPRGDSRRGAAVAD